MRKEHPGKAGKWIIREVIVVWLLLGVVPVAFTQTQCYKYTEAMRSGRTYLEQDSFDLALTEFQVALVAVRECHLSEDTRKSTQFLLELAFNGLEKETKDAVEIREKAVEAKELALRRLREAEAARDASEKALARANALNEQNQRLLDALYFYDDRFALAVRQRPNSLGVDEYGYIDKNGQALINYKYTAAEPFEPNGLARVEFNKKVSLIDTTGREYRLAESLEELTAETQALDLRNQFLRTLPDTVFNFPEIRILLLSGNFIRDLPDQFDQLPQLEILDLARNSVDSLPPSIRSLRSLSVLNLNGVSLRRLPDWMNALVKLQVLDLSNLQLGALPEWIGQLQQLQSLMLNYNDLASLPASFGALKQLTNLDLQHNRLTEIPIFFQEFKKLRRLNLDNNQIPQVPEFIANFSQLQDLSLATNRLESLPASIGQLSQLLRLDLKSNQLSTLPLSFRNLTSLQDLNLSRNPLDGLPVYLRNFKQLRRLQLDFLSTLNGLSDWLGELERLQVLSLSGNAMDQMPAGIEQLSQLEELRLERCGLLTLSPAIGKLRRLERLTISRNTLADLPTEIGQLKRLKLLDLTDNRLEQLPPSIGRMEHLSFLLLNNNRLTTLPTELVRCRKLESLYLEANQLIALPAGIGLLPQLEELNISQNHLETLPVDLGHSNWPIITGATDNPLAQIPAAVSDWNNQVLTLQLIRLWSSKTARESNPDTLKKIHLGLVHLYEGYVRQLKKGIIAREVDLIGRYSSGNSTNQQELDQKLAIGYNDLSWFSLLTGRFTEAEDAVREGIQRDSTYRNLYSKLAPALLLQGKIEAAKAEYRLRKDQPYLPRQHTTYASAFYSALEQFEKLEIIPASLQDAVAEIKILLQNQ